MPVCADTADIQAHWIEEDDRHLDPMGSKGIGAIGIVGTAAAIGNAVARLREPPTRTPCCPASCDRAPPPTWTDGPAVARPAYAAHPNE